MTAAMIISAVALRPGALAHAGRLLRLAGAIAAGPAEPPPGWPVRAGGVALALNWTLLFGAYGHASISVATIVYHTQPFMLVALGALCFKEKPGARKLACLALAFGGLAAIVAAGRQRLCMRAARSPPASRWPWAPRSSTRSPPSSPRA